ncbi:MAG: hypothetical protein VXY93_00645, partial [Pseudomonadota bacterium]|nr:hypothetical protein [Pseudomonadota bacterium]
MASSLRHHACYRYDASTGRAPNAPATGRTGPLAAERPLIAQRFQPQQRDPVHLPDGGAELGVRVIA